ncbi:MAG: sulfatase [Verrucomicrobiota bacterium]
MKRTLILLLCALCSVLGAAERPNIVFLLADDQAFDTLGCYGNEDVTTPNIDGLAADGVAFDNHYNTSAICMASRANIFTGLYEYRHGCNFGLGDLPEEHWAKSYPILLREAGYVTAMAGKIGIAVEGVGLPEEDFDKWGAGPGQTNYATAKNKSIAHYADEFPHSTRAYGAFGRDFIQESAASGKPFCLSISFKAPHQPTTPDPAFDDVYEGKTFRKPANYGREHGGHFSEQSRQGRQYERFHSWNYSDKFDEVMATYHQQIYGIDVAVGMIREALEKAGVADNTVVIYTSDNGFFCGAHGYGSKVLPYEESSRVPLIIHDPRLPVSERGKRTSALTGNIDLYSTILECGGLSAPTGVDGVSLVSLLSHAGASVRDSLQLMNFWGPVAVQSFGVINADWKYIYWYYSGEGMTPAEEMYDMQTDRLELVNAALNSDAKKPLKKMRRLYDSAVASIADLAQRPVYAKYATIFDRTTAWPEKQALLEAPQKEKKSKK